MSLTRKTSVQEVIRPGRDFVIHHMSDTRKQPFTVWYKASQIWKIAMFCRTQEEAESFVQAHASEMGEFERSALT